MEEPYPKEIMESLAKYAIDLTGGCSTQNYNMFREAIRDFYLTNSDCRLSFLADVMAQGILEGIIMGHEKVMEPQNVALTASHFSFSVGHALEKRNKDFQKQVQEILEYVQKNNSERNE